MGWGGGGENKRGQRLINIWPHDLLDIKDLEESIQNQVWGGCRVVRRYMGRRGVVYRVKLIVRITGKEH